MEPSNSRVPQLYLEYRFYQMLGPQGVYVCVCVCVCVF
jgi:hypothetical protein